MLADMTQERGVEIKVNNRMTRQIFFIWPLPNYLVLSTRCYYQLEWTGVFMEVLNSQEAEMV